MSDAEELSSRTAAHPPERVDVVIVGAGLAGLTAARELMAAGVSAAVIEARARVGGRTLSVDVGKGTFDLGAQWIGPHQRRVAALASELGVGTHPTYAQGERLLDRGGRISSYRGVGLLLPRLRTLELRRGLRRLERLAAEVPLHNPGAARAAEAWDAISIEAWKRDNLRAKPPRDLVDIAVRALFGAEACELSLLHFLFFLRSGGGLERLLAVRDGARQDRMVRGAQQLALGLADILRDRVMLRAPVRRIAQDAAGVVAISERGSVRARYAIVAVPPVLSSRIEYEPALPAVRDQLTQRAPMGSTVKCLLTYERPFWRERGLSGEALSDGLPASAVYDNCSHDNAQPALVAFVCGRAAREWENRSPGDRRRALVRQLVRYFGAEAENPTEVVEKNWGAERWTRGGPVGFAAPGMWTTFGPTLRQPVGRIHWAGTETATDWNGHMEGAIESGERAATEILRRL